MLLLPKGTLILIFLANTTIMGQRRVRHGGADFMETLQQNQKL